MSRTFTAELDSELSREELRREILTNLSLPLGRAGYQSVRISSSLPTRRGQCAGSSASSRRPRSPVA